MTARSLELFFIDGRPDGMLTAEVFNWTGHVLRFPRTQLIDALKRPETDHTGVYILIGEQDGVPGAYIGEAETLSVRLKGHAAQKDWWDTAVCISTTGDLLHKAHVKYLESRLVEKAQAIAAVPLENANTPPRSSLSEAAVANMESFLETLDILLPAIRIDMFLDKVRSTPPTDRPSEVPRASLETHFALTSPKYDLSAQAVLRDGEWIVQAGSNAQPKWIGTTDTQKHYVKLQAELVANGTLAVENGLAAFQKDYAFTSPSAAAAIITGRSINGRTAWRHAQSGKTYAEWEEELLQQDHAT